MVERTAVATAPGRDPQMRVESAKKPSDRRESEHQAIRKSEVEQPAMRFQSFYSRVLKHHWFSWVVTKSTWVNWKPVIRCAVAVSMRKDLADTQAWVGLVLQLILPVERTLGFAACESPQKPADDSLRHRCRLYTAPVGPVGSEHRKSAEPILFLRSCLGMGGLYRKSSLTHRSLLAFSLPARFAARQIRQRSLLRKLGCRSYS